uniref:Uncharacterized protein n=1 Tax=Arundo donax TaxID=35708 RepID=A0A0A9GLF3_ARUDO
MRSLLLVSGSNSDSGTSPSSLAGEPCSGSEKPGSVTGWLNEGDIMPIGGANGATEDETKFWAGATGITKFAAVGWNA